MIAITAARITAPLSLPRTDAYLLIKTTDRTYYTSTHTVTDGTVYWDLAADAIVLRAEDFHSTLIELWDYDSYTRIAKHSVASFAVRTGSGRKQTYNGFFNGKK
jgi:hypothetical protein